MEQNFRGEIKYFFYYKCRACNQLFELGADMVRHPSFAMERADKRVTHDCHAFGEGSFGVAELVGLGTERDPKLKL